ncbi:MAG: T9SS type A sorting domain-containing protein [Bacteroidales bacterium]|nr:T9SS type A sorting domain-containing protein [Bacteroidales bacterium]
MNKLLITFLILNFFIVLNVFSDGFNYDITYHKLEFYVNPSVKYIEGKITTHYKPLYDDFNQISFNLDDKLIVDSVKQNNIILDFTHLNDTLTITLTRNSPKLEVDSISVYYHGVPANNGFGSFSVSSHRGTPILWTLSEPFGAKTWWPCKEALNDKADSIDLLVTVPKQYKVAGNGLIFKETITNDSLKTVFWKHRYPITAYLIAFSVTNYAEYYDYVKINDSITIPILEYVYPEDSVAARRKTSDIIDVLKFYSDTFMLYPFANEKYGQAQFGWGGGMEHQTMTFLSNFNHELMAHELAHQWFGNYITCGSWHDIWLNEGFAVYLEGLTCEQGLAPKSWDRWKKTTMYQATIFPYGSVYVEDTTSVSRIFDYNLTYMKGGMLLHLLRWQIGDKAFFDGIRNYLHDPKLAYSYATIDDLKKHFENTCNCDLTYFFDDWYYGQGYPIYKIDWWQTNDNKLHIKINQRHSAGEDNFFELKIPVKIYSNYSDSIIVLNNTKQDEIFMFDENYKISNIIFDPETWIITTNVVVSQIIKNIDDVDVKITPNPVQNKFLIEFPIETTIKNYAIFDTLGKEFANETLNLRTNKLHINVKYLNAGIYILNVTTTDGFITKNFIKN